MSLVLPYRPRDSLSVFILTLRTTFPVMPIAGVLAGLRPIGQIVGGIGSLASDARYAHSSFNPRVHHQVRMHSAMPNYRKEDPDMVDAESDHVIVKAPSGDAVRLAFLAFVVRGDSTEDDPVAVERYRRENSCAEQEVVDALAALRISQP